MDDMITSPAFPFALLAAGIAIQVSSEKRLRGLARLSGTLVSSAFYLTAAGTAFLIFGLPVLVHHILT